VYQGAEPEMTTSKDIKEKKKKKFEKYFAKVVSPH
jgi:hypothetical protein